MEEMKISSLFDLEHTIAADLLRSHDYVWEVLPLISETIKILGAKLDPAEFDEVTPGVWIAKDAKIAPTASISAPAIIGRGTEVRPGAFIRGSALVGDGAVVGNSSELKNCILFDGVQVPHFNYVGDSVLGYRAHLGAGAVTSNIKSDKTNVTVRFGEEKIATGLRKMGAAVGDFVEVGCNSVLNPGTVIGRNSTVYPLSLVRGFIPAGSIVKAGGVIVKKTERN